MELARPLCNSSFVIRHSLLPAHLSAADADPLVSGQFIEAHRAARADFVSADADFGAHAKFAAIGEARGGIPINRGGIDLVQKLFGASFVRCDDAVRVRRAIMIDVIDRLLYA